MVNQFCAIKQRKNAGFASGDGFSSAASSSQFSGCAVSEGPSALGHALPILRFNPNLFRGGYAQGNPAGSRGQGQRLVVVAMRDVNFGAGANTALFQKLKQAAIAFIDAAHLKVLAGLSLRKQDQAAPAPAGGTLQLGQIAVRTRASTPEFGEQPGLEIWRNRVLQTFRLVVHLIPFHSENLGEHALDQVVANRQLAGDLSSGSGQANAAAGMHPHQAIFF